MPPFAWVPSNSSLLSPIGMIDNQADTVQCFSTVRNPSDYSSSVVFPPLKKDHIAKGIDQNNPPIAPIATTVAKVIGSEFGIPKRGPNKGTTEVIHPTGIRILRLTSGHSASFDILLTMNAESTANKNQPPHNNSKDSGSISGRMNTTRTSIASIAPVAAPEKRMFFDFMNSANLRFLIRTEVKI